MKIQFLKAAAIALVHVACVKAVGEEKTVSIRAGADPVVVNRHGEPARRRHRTSKPNRRLNRDNDPPLISSPSQDEETDIDVEEGENADRRNFDDFVDRRRSERRSRRHDHIRRRRRSRRDDLDRDRRRRRSRREDRSRRDRNRRRSRRRCDGGERNRGRDGRCRYGWDRREDRWDDDFPPAEGSSSDFDIPATKVDPARKAGPSRDDDPKTGLPQEPASKIAERSSESSTDLEVSLTAKIA